MSINQEIPTPIEKYLRVGLSYYFVRYIPSLCSVNFMTWEVAGWTQDPWYGNDYSSNPDEVTPFIKGDVKWDGSSHFTFPEKLMCNDRAEMANIGVLLPIIHDQCIRLCPNAEHFLLQNLTVVEDVPDADFPWNRPKLTYVICPKCKGLGHDMHNCGCSNCDSNGHWYID